MTISIKQVNDSEHLESCWQILADVFHGELSLFGMKIPDNYEDVSHYMQIFYSGMLVGTYRIICANSCCGLPIEELDLILIRFRKTRYAKCPVWQYFQRCEGRSLLVKLSFLHVWLLKVMERKLY